MSTVGHPLSDLANFLNPWLTARLLTERPPGTPAHIAHPGFAPGATPGLPTPDELKRAYYDVILANGPVSGLPESIEDREREMRWAEAFGEFRAAAICQGIAARFAARQASSDKASQYAKMTKPLAEFAWRIVRSVQEEAAGKGASGSRL